MPRTEDVSTIIDILSALDSVPTAGDVHGQESTFCPRHWKNRWPEHLDLGHVPVLRDAQADDNGDGCLSRADLFTLGREVVSPETALNFFVAVYAWGSGRSAIFTSRGIKVLQSADAHTRILSALEAMRDSDFDPGTGYRVFSNYYESKVKYLGPAFFTKLMYFYSHARATRTSQLPLILDSRVAGCLGWSQLGDWSTRSYVQYIAAVDEARKELGPDVTGEVIEYVLFERAKGNI